MTEALKYHVVEITGNVATTVFPSEMKKNGEPSVNANPREYCAACLNASKNTQAGIFVDGICMNCGTSRSGKLQPTWEEILEAEEEAKANGEPSPLEVAYAKAHPNYNNDNSVGQDGLPRKVYIRDVVLSDLGVTKGAHYQKLVYREILEDEEKPEDFDPDCKYKRLTLVGFNADTSPATTEEMQEKLPEQVVVEAG